VFFDFFFFNYFQQEILMKAAQILVALAAVWIGSASAQTLTDVKVSAAQVKVGETVQATANLEVTQGLNCGLRISWGDGTTTDSKVNQTKDVPMVVSHQYAKPGNYTVVAEPRRVGPVLKCSGKNQSTNVSVVALAPVAVAPAPAPAVVAAAPAVVAAAPVATAPAVAESKTVDMCPKGWKPGKSGVKPNGAFTCTAPKNTKVPKEEIMCVEKLKYFADSKSGQLGCR
jgi:hypothetical protein